MSQDHTLPILKIDLSVEREQLERLKELRQNRDAARVEAALKGLAEAAVGMENLMPHILESVKAYATVGEICARMRSVFGEYREQPVL